MTTNIRLPATHLQGETITALETVLTAGSTDPEVTVTLEHGSVTYRYESIDEIRRDSTLPPVIRSFEVIVTAREGRIVLCSDRWENALHLAVEGNRDWVAERRREFGEFFSSHGARLRTFMERYLAVLLTAAVVSGSLLAYYAGYGSLIGMRMPADSLLYGSLAVFVGGMLHWLLSAVYPYAVIVSGRGADRFLLYLRS